MSHVITRCDRSASSRLPRRIRGWLSALALGAAINGGACYVHEPEVDPVYQGAGDRAALVDAAELPGGRLGLARPAC